jgi:hypothetical protein
MKQGLNTINAYIFNSFPGETVPLSATNTSSSVKFALPASKANYDVIVTNAGANIAFIAFGDSASGSVVAQVPGTTGTQNATPITGGSTMTFQKNSDSVKADTCAAISAAGTTLYFTSVQGS